LPHATARDHQVELVGGDIAAGVAHLDDHLLALDQLGAGIVGIVLTLTSKLDAVALPAIRVGFCDVSVRNALANRLGRLVVAGVSAAARAGALRVARLARPVLTAAMTVGLRAMGLTAVPVARGVAVARGHVW
jgi:hypothetical protein